MVDRPLIEVLLVEDDVRLAELTRDYLTRQDMVVTVEHDGTRGLSLARRGGYDVLLLDLMLPGTDGIAICQQVRQVSDVPIIMLTARGEEVDRVLGLEIGADDYMPKPFSARELSARIRSVLRRTRGRAGPPPRDLVTVGALTLDPGSLTATLQGNRVALTSYEFALLLAMAQRAGRVLSRDALMNLAKGNAEDAFDRSVDVHISRLRQKLGDDSRHPWLIRTIRGVGYQLLTEDQR